jgi:hypothetical protein
MTEPVVMIAVPAENRAEPIEKRDARVGVVPAYAKDADVESDQRVTQGRELELAISREQDDDPGVAGRDLERPCKTIVRPPPRPAEDDGDDEQQREMGGAPFSCGRYQSVLREFNREGDRGDHAVGVGNALAGNLEGGSVIRARPHKRETQRHIHALMEGMQLQRNQTLIVIHAEHSIPITVRGVVEECVRRKRPGEDW